jgi:hypothetical protein
MNKRGVGKLDGIGEECRMRRSRWYMSEECRMTRSTVDGI